MTAPSSTDTAGRAATEGKVLLHTIAAPPGSSLEQVLRGTRPSYLQLPPLVGPFPHPVVRVSGPDARFREASSGLPEGAAQAEAVAVRLRRAGVALEWGPASVVDDVQELVRLSRARGRSSVEMVRADPSLLTEMQIGSFFHAYWRTRVVLRALARVGLPRSGSWMPTRLARVAADAAFWAGVRSAATSREWDRLAKSSYLVLYYHRIAGAGAPGYAHLDVHPRRFERQLLTLGRLGLRPLSPDEVAAFHADPEATLEGKRYVLAADDGILESVDAFREHGDLHPQMFVCTAHVGGTATWSDGARLAGWDELRELQRAGGYVGSHARSHTPLTELPNEALEPELAGALRDLDEHLPGATRALAYPHGLHDERVRAAAMASGYQVAYTTLPGRNGAGTDRYCLRRIELKDWDGALLLAWLALTGEPLPWPLERVRRLLKGPRAARRGARAPRSSGAS